MVEGHSCHRIAISHGKRLVGRKFRAASPNGRFAEGAKLIDGREFSRIEAIGKNLFAFFSAIGSPDVVMHVHFGMSGRWSLVDAARAPEVKPTTRLVLEGHGLVSHLSAMTVDHGGPELFEAKRRALGHDPLRTDADPDALFAKVSRSSKSIGKLLMDQSAFAGVGNIFRCEILNVARLHPEVKGNALTRQEFDVVWAASVELMSRARTLGSIVTVTPDEARAVGRPSLRRWIYNSPTCGRCGGRVTSWQIQARTCYACVQCQPLSSRTHAVAPPADASAPTVFLSHCASESLAERRTQPQKLRVAELRSMLEEAGLPTGGRKAQLVARLERHGNDAPPDTQLTASAGDGTAEEGKDAASGGDASAAVGAIRSARAAAADKAAVNESRAVEHIAEWEDLDDGAPDWLSAGETPAEGANDGGAAASGHTPDARPRKRSRAPDATPMAKAKKPGRGGRRPRAALGQ